MKTIFQGCLIVVGVVIVLSIAISLFPWTDQNPIGASSPDSVANVENTVLTMEDLREQLEREINSINEGVDFASYRGSAESLRMEFLLFASWADLIKRCEVSGDEELKQLASRLKPKVVALQIKEFPLLRKEYAKIMANKLWENDIYVHTSGTGSRYINFTGGAFAANKNKKDFQAEVYDALQMFRFTKAIYRWYKGQDDYVYWTIESEKDSELVKK